MTQNSCEREIKKKGNESQKKEGRAAYIKAPASCIVGYFEFCKQFFFTCWIFFLLVINVTFMNLSMMRTVSWCCN